MGMIHTAGDGTLSDDGHASFAMYVHAHAVP